LRKRFRWNRKVTVIPKGLAEKPGTLDFSICSEAHTISTFSEQWKTGRFAEYKWDKVIQVPVTTLDALIAAHGVPAYCKVDVEGFELSVLKGLTRPLPLLSFEFSREFIDNARECARYLEGVGFDRFNYAAGEDPHFAAQDWLTVEGLFGQLAQNADPMFWGDIYAQSSQVPAPGSYSRSGFLHEIVRFFRPHDAPK
jgi:FkbM family methyltransferase